MLGSLFIRDFAIAGHIEIDFAEGLTAVTGETGAGKSIVVDALGLALGARTDSSFIRHGAEYAEVIANFEPNAQARQWLDANALASDGECILRRLIYRTKPAKAFINGRPATAQAQRELGGFLVEIHGQHEHQSLLQHGQQQEILDQIGGLGAAVTAVAGAYQVCKDLDSRLESLTRQACGDESQLTLTRHQAQELESLQPRRDEYRSLERQHKRLAHAQELEAGVRQSLHELYDADQGAITTVLAQCIQRLAALVEYEPDLAEVSPLLEQASVQVDEAINVLRGCLNRVDWDPEQLDTLERRIRDLLDTARKHRCDPDDLPEVLERLQFELNELEHLDEVIAETHNQLERARADYLALAQELTKQRNAAARALSTAVTDQLDGLGLGGGQFHVQVKSVSAAQATVHGVDHIEFQVSTNPGLPLRPLAKVASGGELSRISLAIQVICADTARVSTLIFDEIDVGIGGRVAEVVGQKLRRLGATHQVLCITHLPQVAAQGHHHMRVRKFQDDQTVISVDTLDEGKRVTELARMLGGMEVTEQTLAHAEDMLDRRAV